MRVKVVVVPVYRKHWLYHAWTEAMPQASQAESTIDWRKGATLGDKVQLLKKNLDYKVNDTVQQQWQSLEAAPDGSFKNKLLRLAKWVLSKEDPVETFLKAIPPQPLSVEVIFPASMKEALVRRRLRRLVNARQHIHQRRILGWGLATLPQLPLMITPLPNVTLYYCMYKIASQYQAVQGCRSLQAGFRELDAWQAQQAARKAGMPWPLRLLPGGHGSPSAASSSTSSTKYSSSNSSTTASASAGADGGSRAVDTALSAASASGAGNSGRVSSGRQQLQALVVKFTPNKALDHIVRPLDRWSTPLSDEAAERLVKLLGSSSIVELVTRTKNLALPPVLAHGTRTYMRGATAAP